MVSQTLRGRVAAPLLALAVSGAAGFVGSLITRHATAADAVAAPAPFSPPTSAQLAAKAPSTAGWVEATSGSSTFTMRTIGGAEITVLLTHDSRYYVYPSPVQVSAGVVRQGVFVVVDGHVQWLQYSVVAVNVTVIPHFRGARPGFEGHRDGILP
ncbi:MAG: hypothetical protein JO198_10425 [Candidatus Dormibacteraeota bacterium]|nr:hypothetical protein [Candidatus Dormibacteraeota bacterium]